MGGNQVHKGVQIGAGSQVFDTIILVINIAILLVCGICSLLYPEARPLCAIGATAIVVQNLLRIRINYIFIEGDHFVIRNLFRPPKKINTSEFVRVLQNPFSIPFSNSLILVMKSGKRFYFQGGTRGFLVVEAQVKRAILDGLMAESYKNQ